MLALAAFTIILAWPDTSPEAVKRASELGAAVLVVPAAAHAPEAPRGLEVVAAVAADGKAVAAAKDAGFGGVMIDAPEDDGALKALFKEHGSFIRIVSLKREQAHRDVSPAMAAVRTGQWPGLMALNGEAAATEQPWINSNLHQFAWLEGFYPKRMPVLDYEPPLESMQYEGAEIALAEAWAFGGAVVLRLPPAYREGLARGDARALGAWERLCAVAAFLKKTEGGARQSASSLAVLVPQWDEEFEEILNLAWRQQLSPRAMAAEGFAPAQGLRMVAAPNQALPRQTQARLREFAAAGGIVLVTPEPGKPVEPWWGHAKPAGKEGGIETFRAGRGTVRVMEEPALDPFVFALDLREQLGMDNPSGRGLHGLDVRLWHAATAVPVLRKKKQGELTVVLIGYGRWIEHDFLAGARGQFRGARMEQPGSEAAPMKLMPRGGRVEWNQPGLHRIAVVTLEEAVR